jgi:dCMP deaminase
MTKTEYYLRIARTVAEKSTCLKKQYGAIIINNDELVASGYNDTCRKEPHCTTCTKPSGNGDIEEYTTCPAVHAEQNAIISASRNEMLGATLYLVGKIYTTGELVSDASSCALCKRMIINAGIEKVIIRNDKDNYTVVEVSDWIENDDSLSGTFGY